MFMLVRIVEISECRTGAVEFLCYFYLDDAERMWPFVVSRISYYALCSWCTLSFLSCGTAVCVFSRAWCEYYTLCICFWNCDGTL